jgi:hypothetical protein
MLSHQDDLSRWQAPDVVRELPKRRKTQEIEVRVHGDAWLADDSRRPCSRGLKYSLSDPRQTST